MSSPLRFAVADLGRADLDLADRASNSIRIDDDAARFGWAVVGGQWSVDDEPATSDQGQMTKDGLDLLTVVMHELGHLLGYDHSDDPDDLMAPVLATGQACGGSELEAVESRGQSRWRRPSSPSVTALASTPRMPSWAGMETTSCFRSCWSRSMSAPR